MSASKPGNQGEGNREADRKFREAETRFVRSEEGKRRIAQAGNLSEDEARRLRETEQRTKARAKDEDPAISHGSGGSSGR